MPVGGCSQSAKEIKSTSDVMNRFSLNVGIKANANAILKKFSFSASVGYKKMTQTCKKQDKFFSEASCSYSHLKAQLKPAEYLTMDPIAKKLADQISGPLCGANYKQLPQWRFIERYGTHYFDTAVLGGKYQMTYEIDKAYVSTHGTKDLSASTHVII